jgi:hypothetical protein
MYPTVAIPPHVSKSNAARALDVLRRGDPRLALTADRTSLARRTSGAGRPTPMTWLQFLVYAWPRFMCVTARGDQAYELGRPPKELLRLVYDEAPRLWGYGR